LCSAATVKLSAIVSSGGRPDMYPLKIAVVTALIWLFGRGKPCLPAKP
jgi:hypothetical protein